MDQFVLFGDSITQHCFSREGPDGPGVFGPLLADAFTRRLDVINRGCSGYNTKQALQVVSKVIPSPQHARVRFLTIFFGANDARLPDTPPDYPQQHIPLQQFKDNLRAIVLHPSVQAHVDIRIILVTPPPVDERKQMAADAVKYPEYGSLFRRSAVTTASYAQAVCDLGAELQLPVLDIWTAMMRETRSEGHILHGTTIPGSKDALQSTVLQAFLLDGLHFSHLAYYLLFRELMALVSKTWPDQMPEKLPFVLPKWDDEQAWKDDASSML